MEDLDEEPGGVYFREQNAAEGADAAAYEAFRDDERRRMDALARRDPASYARLCDELGVDPELPDLFERGREELEIADSMRTAVPTFRRRIYVETEQLGKKIANAFEVAGKKLSLVSISGSVVPAGRDDAGESYRFSATVELGTLREKYTHPGSLCIPHDDRKELDKDLTEYKAQCIAEIIDAIERQGQGRLTVEHSQFVDLAVRIR